MFICSYASNKQSRVGAAAGNAFANGVSDTTARSVDGAVSSTISGGNVLQGASNGAVGGLGGTVGAAAGSVIRELLK